ncbi:ParB N-terminal domain-containing protein [Proteiniclasticum sp. QWL-01]|nr:ParB N-terminal domain-containing protein [Proteiniclasticum sp. QWL-01]WFF74613.1 ParB N-terminal domain-containing protein [Proteiniclasticum sp. QWL-01]
MKEHGVIQPILVTRDKAGSDYIIVAGERRWRAAKKAGLKEVPVVEMDLTNVGNFNGSISRRKHSASGSQSD